MAYIFSKGCGYGIQATLFVAMHDGKRVGGKEIAKSLAIPTHFLAKILQALSESGILVSHKGAQGGFALGRPAEEIHLTDIVDAIDGLDVLHECVLGLPDCGTANPCFMHERWGGVRDEIETLLSEDSIADLLLQSRKGIRIAGVPIEVL
jgi:Rrf2 family transcriptional regulator, iron-sulfur cluster assembly transcription factor